MIGKYFRNFLSYRYIFPSIQIHQFMTGRIKFVDTSGTVLYPANEPEIPYAYEEASAYDQEFGNYGVSAL